MRWLTNFYDFRFKRTATAAIGIHPTKAWLSQLVNFKNAIWTLEERYAIRFYFKLGKMPDDESWIYCYDPETKRQSSQWKHAGSPRPKKARQSKSTHKAFDSIHRGKMEQILLAYGLRKETIAAIMMLYRNTKVKVCSPNGDTHYFDIVAGLQQGNTLAPYLFVICIDYVLRTSTDKIKKKRFQANKGKKQKVPCTNNYRRRLALLANTPAQAETLLHCLERVAACIGLHVSAHKTEYMCFNQTGDISTLNGSSLKLIDEFTYLGSSVSLTEKDINTRRVKVCTAIDRLSVIWKSDLTDKIKCSYIQAAVVSKLLYGCTTWTLTKRLEKKLDVNYTRMLRAILNKSWRQHPTKQQLYGHLPPITKTIKVRRTRYAGHCGRSRDELISGPLHMDEQRQDDQLEPTYSSSVPIWEVTQETCWKQWTIGRGGERGSGRSVLVVRYDDDIYMRIHLYTYT